MINGAIISNTMFLLKMMPKAIRWILFNHRKTGLNSTQTPPYLIFDLI